MEEFRREDLKKLYRPHTQSSGEDNGQITIIGGSKLFHGAPIFALKAASRFVDMLFFATPEPSVGKVAERIKSELLSFIWVPWEDVEDYVEKSDAILIGPGFMRFGSEKNKHHVHNGDCDEECQFTRGITRNFLSNFADKKWVIDAGSLQSMDAEWIPKNAILTPNKKEYKQLFGDGEPIDMADKYKCTIVVKGPETVVYSQERKTVVKGGNPGLTKGGTGDALAGLTTALYAKNDAHLAACAASFILKAAADELYKERGIAYHADDLVDNLGPTYASLII